MTLCADIQQAMDALGQEQACIVGHDWGAVVAWHLALLEPQRVKALATLSVPFAGRPKRPAVEIMRELFAERFNYILYFQEPGVAERELDADIDRSLLHFMHDCERLLDEKARRPCCSRACLRATHRPPGARRRILRCTGAPLQGEVFAAP